MTQRMADLDNIPTFLETPPSLEIESERDYNKCKSSRTRSRKRRALPCEFVTYKSVYEQKDLTKLTERQRIMALKFRANAEKATRLFLAVNELDDSPWPTGQRIEMADVRGKKWIKQRQMKPNSPKLACRTKRAEKCSAPAFSSSILKLSFYQKVACKNCLESAKDILEFSNWLYKNHYCPLSTEIKAVRDSIAYLIGKEDCICKSEAVYYYELAGISERNMCKCTSH